MDTNPFKPTFGQAPTFLAGRDKFIEDFVEGLENGPGDPNRATIVVGPRGSGKTVLIQEVSRQAASLGWITVSVTCAEGMLDEILVLTRKRGSHLLDLPPQSRVTSVQAAGFGASREVVPVRTTWRSDMEDLVDGLNEQGVGLLITIDEVSATSEALKAFIIAYQHFVTEGRNVALLMAGLASKVSSLLLDDEVSFVRRAIQRELGSIDLADVELAMLSTVESSGRSIAPKVLHEAASATSGYAYMIQLVGYYMWRQRPQKKEIDLADVELAHEQALHEMKRAVYVPTLREMTRREAEFVGAMAQEGPVTTLHAVAGRMGISTNNAGKLRRRLVERGAVGDLGHGRMAIEIPGMGDYLKAMDADLSY
ncbi:MAG: ATP-binding protein [Eggerthellaceae bacterium]|nr:ATP-binding protein [Eggerthellaceae bacterium]